MGVYLERNFPQLKDIAFDVISLSSLTDLDRGRKTHRKILGRGIRIYEEVQLSILNYDPDKKMVFPLW